MAHPHLARGLLIAALSGFSAAAVAAPTYTTIYDFTQPDGQYGQTLTAGPGGVLYGTNGDPFRLLPPVSGQTAWTFSYLTSGEQIAASPLALEPDGTLVGTHLYGGPYENGSVFRLTPPPSGHGAWSETTIFDGFSPARGVGPRGALYVNSSGIIYGTTYGGGASDAGSAYMLRPPSGAETAWTYTTLAFLSGPNGHSRAGLILGIDGSLYGGGADAVWRLVPPVSPGGHRTLQTVLKFSGGPIPNGGGTLGAGPIADRGLNVYGNTIFGGQRYGVVFRLRPPAIGQTGWTEDVLHAFVNQSDGSYPDGLIESKDGVFYGTTSGCPARFGGTGCGTIFSLTPRDYGGHVTPWTLSTFHAFGPDADTYTADPSDDLVKQILPDGRVALFGTTLAGGRYGYGTIYEVIP